jgi:hypothetical protein
MHKEKTKPGTSAMGNPVKVAVRAYLDETTQKVKFEETWEATWGKGSGKNEPIVFPDKMQANIHFSLKDETGLHLNFYPFAVPHQPPTPPEDYPIYVGTGTACPPPPGIAGGQITILSSASNLLKVFNNNTTKCDLKYALRFSGDDNIAGNESQPYIDDPDIKNGGGGVGGINNNAMLYLAIGVGLAALGYVAYLAFSK